MVSHWHVSGDTATGTETFLSTMGEVALDALAHMLQGHSASYEDQTDEDSVYAESRYENFCTCNRRSCSDSHLDALAAIERGASISESIDGAEFEMRLCKEKDCLKYCPDAECSSVTPIDDTDTRCWSCGADYVPWDACTWLDAVTA